MNKTTKASAEMEKLLCQLRGFPSIKQLRMICSSDTGCNDLRNRVQSLEFQIRDYIRTLEKEHAAMKTALTIVATGIWRKPEMNACGLSGGSLAVHTIEEILSSLTL